MITALERRVMFTELEKRLWTVEEYYAMADAGILGEDDRVELICGEIVIISPIGVRHAACVNRLTRLFVKRLGGKSTVSVQNPIVIYPDSEPQPDLVLLNFRDDDYATRAPTAADVLLLIEIADTTVAYDRKLKLGLYAAAGIPEYWIVNLVDNTIEVHRQPEGDRYAQRAVKYQADDLSPSAFPDESFRVAELIP
jgi:Uma2 family endonuclease